jgi:zinc finger protein
MRGMFYMPEMRIDCPVCHKKNSAVSDTKTVKIPYFGEVMESSIICEACGFKHSDVMSLEQHDPARHSLKINKDNLSSRVIRSQSATVSIPEIGIKVEPGPKSQGYVSNVEGVIVRFKDATQRALTLFDDEESQSNGKKVFNELDKILNGDLEVTLIIDDPFGQSKIMDLKSVETHLSEEELKHLKTGFTIIDNDSEE